MWAGTRVGRLFISKNADAARQNVSYRRLDTSAQPGRFVSGIAIDPANANHAFVSFSGYAAYTPGQPGHVFEVTFHPATGTATWTDLSFNLGDQPITDVVFDDETGDLYASTDFSVLRLEDGGNAWVEAATGLPPVATYGLTIDSSARVPVRGHRTGAAPGRSNCRSADRPRTDGGSSSPRRSLCGRRVKPTGS